jgi:hypothetical protein
MALPTDGWHDRAVWFGMLCNFVPLRRLAHVSTLRIPLPRLFGRMTSMAVHRVKTLPWMLEVVTLLQAEMLQARTRQSHAPHLGSQVESSTRARSQLQAECFAGGATHSDNWVSPDSLRVTFRSWR